MPLFEYRCKACDLTFEKLLKQQSDIAPCPKCGQDARRTVSVFASSGDSSCAAPTGTGFR